MKNTMKSCESIITGIKNKRNELEILKNKEYLIKEFKCLPSNLLDIKVYHSIERLPRPLSDSSTKDTTFSEDMKEKIPAILYLYPLRSHEKAYKSRRRTRCEPFPTIYWLCSKELKSRISLFEERGYVSYFQKKLESKKEYLNEFLINHVDYARERWNLLTDDDKNLVKTSGWEDVLRDDGIAGIKDHSKIKCLHTHYAHYIATGKNIVGKWVHELMIDTTENDMNVGYN